MLSTKTRTEGIRGNQIPCKNRSWQIIAKKATVVNVAMKVFLKLSNIKAIKLPTEDQNKSHRLSRDLGKLHIKSLLSCTALTI